MMAVVVLIALFIPPVLAYLGFLAWPAVLLAEIVILFVAAWGIDRRRKLGARSPVVDANRADIGASTPDGINIIHTPQAAERKSDLPKIE